MRMPGVKCCSGLPSGGRVGGSLILGLGFVGSLYTSGIWGWAQLAAEKRRKHFSDDR